MKTLEKTSIGLVGLFCFLGVIFLFVSVGGPASMAQEVQSDVGYSGKYDQGSAPLSQGAKVRISLSSEGIRVDRLKGGEPWIVYMPTLRGAIATDTGVWIYWFDEGGATFNAYFKMDNGAQSLASDINSAITNFNKKPTTSSDLQQYKERYEQYKEEALKTAR